jgi:hypothetical protein
MLNKVSSFKEYLEESKSKMKLKRMDGKNILKIRNVNYEHSS